MGLRRLPVVVMVMLVVLCASTSPASAAGLPEVSSGARPGPSTLYAPAPPTPPQLRNVAPWQADPILVSGATAYRDGEFLYQDFLYDDHGAVGAQDPSDPFNSLEFLFSPSTARSPTRPTRPSRTTPRTWWSCACGVWPGRPRSA